MKSIVPIAIASAMDIAFSNWSMVYITVSLYTMIKSTSVLFILAFALGLGLEKWRNSLIVVISLIALGLFLFGKINHFGLLLAKESFGLKILKTALSFQNDGLQFLWVFSGTHCVCSFWSKVDAFPSTNSESGTRTEQSNRHTFPLAACYGSRYGTYTLHSWCATIFDDFKAFWS